MGHILIVVMTLFITGCSSDKVNSSLEDFALELPLAIKPGKSLDIYISKIPANSPEQQLAFSYKDLLLKWDYLPDPPNNDHFVSVENIFDKRVFEGDCEDFAAVIMAVCVKVNIKSQIVLGEKQGKGHVWVEVLISQNDVKKATLYKIRSAFKSSASFVKRKDGLWLQLSPEGSLIQYKATHRIDKNGTLEIIYIRKNDYQ